MPIMMTQTIISRYPNSTG